MLKLRVIPVLLYAGKRLVKTLRFDLDAARDVGDPVKSVAVYNSQQADEIILLNIEREAPSWRSLGPMVERLSEVCFTPLTIGGGVSTFEDAAFLISRGADKLIVNTAAYADKALLTRIADTFGAQALVVAIDVRRHPLTRAIELYSDRGRRSEPIGLEEHVGACERAGAGEIFVQSIDRDGAMGGFDTEVLKAAAGATNLPVIGCGGSGHYEHLRAAFQDGGVSAVACGSLFNFSDSNPMRAKAFLLNHGFPMKAV